MVNIISGEKVYLSTFKEEDGEIFEKKQWDMSFMRMLSSDTFTPYNAEEWMEFFRTDGDNERFVFSIRSNEDHSLIGYVSLSNLMFKNRSGELSIGIPDKDNRGKGYGKDAVKIILAYAFMELNLHKVKLTVNGNNLPAIKLYESCGFVREGVDREGLYQDNHWFDLHNYGILKDEWIRCNREGCSE